MKFTAVKLDNHTKYNYCLDVILIISLKILNKLKKKSFIL